MPGLAQNQAAQFVKMILIGDPGTHKTGALTSLVKAGYKLRIYDFDNLLGSLVQFVNKDCPEKIGNVAYQTFTDKLKGVDNPVIMIGNSSKVMSVADGTPTAYIRGLKQLTQWKTADEDYGDPGKWGADTILVLDSLTSAALAAFRYAQAVNPMAKEPQTYYFTAQQLVMNLLYLLASEQMACHVIVIAHIDYDKDQNTGLTKGFPRSIGSAINSQIAAGFNAVLQTKVRPGNPPKRIISTVPDGIVDLKNPISFKLTGDLPVETGLADFFNAVKPQ